MGLGWWGRVAHTFGTTKQKGVGEVILCVPPNVSEMARGGENSGENRKMVWTRNSQLFSAVTCCLHPHNYFRGDPL